MENDPAKRFPHPSALIRRRRTFLFSSERVGCIHFYDRLVSSRLASPRVRVVRSRRRGCGRGHGRGRPSLARPTRRSCGDAGARARARDERRNAEITFVFRAKSEKRKASSEFPAIIRFYLPHNTDRYLIPTFTTFRRATIFKHFSCPPTPFPARIPTFQLDIEIEFGHIDNSF